MRHPSPLPSILLLASLALLACAPQQATAGRKGTDWSYFPEEAPTTHERIKPHSGHIPKPAAAVDPSSPTTHPRPRTHSKSKPSIFPNPKLRDPAATTTTATTTPATTTTTRRNRRHKTSKTYTTIYHHGDARTASATPTTPTADATTPAPTPRRPSHDHSREWSYFDDEPAATRQYTYMDELQSAEGVNPHRHGRRANSRRHLHQPTPPPAKLPLYFDSVTLDRSRPFPPPEKASTALNTNTSYFASPTDSRLPIKFRGGSTLDLAYVHLIFVGDSWDPKAVQLLSSPINASIHFMLNVDKSRWWNTARFYGNNGDTTWSSVPGRVQLKQAKILPIPDTAVTSEPNLIDYLEYYLKNKRLDFFVNSSIYFFVLPDTRPNLVSSPGNDESCTKWCGIHSYIGARFLDETTNTEVFYNITYGAVVHPLSCGDKLWQCAARGLWGSDPATGRLVAPNSFVADAIINVMAHELAETVADPYKDAWLDDDRAEPADKCNYNFGNFASEPYWWNVRIGRRPFLVQSLWHPVAQTCAVNSTSDPTQFVEAPAVPRDPPVVA